MLTNEMGIANETQNKHAHTFPDTDTQRKREVHEKKKTCERKMWKETVKETKNTDKYIGLNTNEMNLILSFPFFFHKFFFLLLFSWKNIICANTKQLKS